MKKDEVYNKFFKQSETCCFVRWWRANGSKPTRFTSLNKLNVSIQHFATCRKMFVRTCVAYNKNGTACDKKLEMNQFRS